MKKMKLFIALIGILFLFNSAVAGLSFPPGEDPIKIEKQVEVVYIDDLLGWEIATKVYNEIKFLIPKEYRNIEIEFVFGTEFIEEDIELEPWMQKTFLDFTEEPIALEDWMTKPFSI